MENLNFLKPFPKFCYSIGYIPTSYKVSMTYLEQLEWLCDYLQNTVIPNVNQNGHAVEELQGLFVQLKEYVDNYFENLDVQEEINNKLDEMVENGTLARLVDNSIFVYGIKGSHSCYVTKFEDGKVLVVDAGWQNEWEAIRVGLDDLGITKIDYFIITHFHTDHVYNLQNIIDNYDVSECIFYVMQRPDFENNLDKFLAGEYENYINGMEILTDNGITPVIPENDSYVTINSNYKFHFLNTSLEWFEDYYDVTGEYKPIGKCTLNQFSLYTEIVNTESNSIVAFTGDVEKCTEEKLTDYVHKTFLLTAPHHLSNRASYSNYWEAVFPTYVVAMNPIEEDHYTNDWYGEFQEVVVKRQIPVISHLSEGGNLLKFKITKYGITNFNTGDGLPSFQIPRIYKNLISRMNWEVDREDTISLDNFIYNDMIAGDIVTVQITETFYNNTTQFYSDLLALCPLLTYDGTFSLKIEKLNSGKVILTLRKYELEFVYTRFNKLSNWHRHGNGLISGEITGITNLIAELKKLGIGTFMLTYKPSQDELNNLVENGTYDIVANIKYNDVSNDNIRATIEGTLRNTGNIEYKSQFSGLIDTFENPNFQWKTSPYIHNSTTITGISNLIDYIKNYKNKIITTVYQGTGDELNVLEEGTYYITIFIESNYIENDTQIVKAFVQGQLKHTGGSSTDKCRSFSGYINTSSDPTYVWLQTNG